MDKKDVIEAEIISEKSSPSEEPSEIKRYREEIVTYQNRRRVFITWGVILTAVCFIGIIVFSILWGVILAKEVTKPNDPSAQVITASTIGYMFAIILFALGLDGGIALIVIGAVTNSIKITKRENRIRLYESKK